jgi:hypothetical protein
MVKKERIDKEKAHYIREFIMGNKWLRWKAGGGGHESPYGVGTRYKKTVTITIEPQSVQRLAVGWATEGSVFESLKEEEFRLFHELHKIQTAAKAQ